MLQHSTEFASRFLPFLDKLPHPWHPILTVCISYIMKTKDNEEFKNKMESSLLYDNYKQQNIMFKIIIRHSSPSLMTKKHSLKLGRLILRPSYRFNCKLELVYSRIYILIKLKLRNCSLKIKNKQKNLVFPPK